MSPAVASRLRSLRAATAILAFQLPASATSFDLVSVDEPGIGLNDPAIPSAHAGGAGDTVGQRRENVMLEAARIWAQSLHSTVPIQLQVSFAPLECTDGAVLGSAGPAIVLRDFDHAPISGTWYHAALADSLAGEDLAPESPDIVAQFNSLIDGDDCLPGVSWYYGLDHQPGPGQLDLLAVVLHEIGHGLGISNFVNELSGGQLSDFPDIFSTLTFDLDAELSWVKMSNEDRRQSAINTRRLVWLGEGLRTAAAAVLKEKPPRLITQPELANFSGVVDGASFGPTVDEQPVTAALALVEPRDACSPIAPLEGKVGLVERGSCTFVTKVHNVEAAGGSAMLLRNLSLGSPPGAMTGSGEVGIPSLRLTMSDGQVLEAALNEGPLQVGLAVSPGFWGTDDLGRVLLNAPSPVEPGSSVSHWAPQATRSTTEAGKSPSLLMEPSLSRGLHGLDITVDALRDEGWLTENICGDGLLSAPESCDDGNTSAGDGCSATCNIEFCGNGLVEAPENCDDGNTSAGDGCSATCQPELCGDGIVNNALLEECDDGNEQAGDGCFECRVELCGDGVLNNTPHESCDDGNSYAGDGCYRCQLELCGDGVLNNLNVEQCDDGNRLPGDGCHECVVEVCGDGVINNAPHEQCDDGNRLAGDGCHFCTREVCGDGVINNAPHEQCDDGNLLAGDGCESCRSVAPPAPPDETSSEKATERDEPEPVIPSTPAATPSPATDPRRHGDGKLEPRSSADAGPGGDGTTPETPSVQLAEPTTNQPPQGASPDSSADPTGELAAVNDASGEPAVTPASGEPDGAPAFDSSAPANANQAALRAAAAPTGGTSCHLSPVGGQERPLAPLILLGTAVAWLSTRRRRG